MNFLVSFVIIVVVEALLNFSFGQLIKNFVLRLFGKAEVYTQTIEKEIKKDLSKF